MVASHGARTASLAVEDTQALARRVRTQVLKMVHRARASHVGSCLSMADILAVLYGRVLRIDVADPSWRERDRLIVSKGHAAAAVYAVLAESGVLPASLLDTYCQNGSSLTGHVSHHVPGVEFSTGSLGHGLSVAAGLALAARIDRADWRTFAILSDGECDEGSTWEAAMFAGHHGLGNLIVIIDNNQLQSFGRVSEVLNLEPFGDKWRAFGWAVREIDGHNHQDLTETLEAAVSETRRPTAILCHTVKGKGVSFMEDRLDWHYRSPNDQELERALAEIEGRK